MKKSIIGFTILVVFLCALSACVKGSYEFLNDESEISAIEIVRLCEYDQENNCFKEQLISTVEHHSAFLSDFKKIDCKVIWSEPTGVYEGDVGAKITYQNGEYEFINYYGQGKYRHLENNLSMFDAYAGFRFFDEDQFNDLIEKYSRGTAQKKLLGESFTPDTFFNINEGEPRLSDAAIKQVISNIPHDKYEAYPNTHTVPISATLYKDGEIIYIEASDPRLIRLTNFFNNCVYYSQCAYTQGLLPLEDVKQETTAPFRLELKYAPYGDEGPSPYGRCTTMCDTIIITNSYSFTLIAHDLPGYEGQEERYPYRAVGFYPLYNSAPWLDLFGF